MLKTQKLYWNRKTCCITLSKDVRQAAGVRDDMEFVAEVNADRQIVLTFLDPARMKEMFLRALREERNSA